MTGHTATGSPEVGNRLATGNYDVGAFAVNLPIKLRDFTQGADRIGRCSSSLR
jgi:hypothetical protein